jgi:hypothetical protein
VTDEPTDADRMFPDAAAALAAGQRYATSAYAARQQPDWADRAGLAAARLFYSDRRTADRIGYPNRNPPSSTWGPDGWNNPAVRSRT